MDSSVNNGSRLEVANYSGLFAHHHWLLPRSAQLAERFRRFRLFNDSGWRQRWLRPAESRRSTTFRNTRGIFFLVRNANELIINKMNQLWKVFRELVSQRLAQGFQLIILPNKHSVNDNEYLLSIGRIFHKIVLKGSTITVTGYRPRHPYPTCNIHYRYRLQAPDHDRYEVSISSFIFSYKERYGSTDEIKGSAVVWFTISSVHQRFIVWFSMFQISWVDFNAEKLENYNWNHLDHYICTRGDRDFALTESLKYWRLRLCVLPTNAQETPYPERVLRLWNISVDFRSIWSQPYRCWNFTVGQDPLDEFRFCFFFFFFL